MPFVFSFRKTMRSLFLGTSFFLTILSFQNCGKFDLLMEEGTLSTSSSKNVILSDKPAECKTLSGSINLDCKEIVDSYRSTYRTDPSIADIDYWMTQKARGASIKSVQLALKSLNDSPHLNTQKSQDNVSRSFHWGAWVEGIPVPQGQPEQTTAQFRQMVGRGASLAGMGVWWYPETTWSDFDTLLNNPSKEDLNFANSTRAAGAIPVLLWGAFDPSQKFDCRDPKSMQHLRNYSLKSLAAGKHDAYIRKWAKQIAKWGHPIYMRTMHELNSSNNIPDLCDPNAFFTTWTASLTVQGEVINRPEEAIPAWRHIVDIFRSEGAHNVRWIWSVLSWPSAAYGGNNKISMREIYPGDEYVDWVGIECYNFESSDYISCSDRMIESYKEITEVSPRRPILNVEMGAREDSRKPTWLSEALTIDHPDSMYNRYPRMNGFMYWNDHRYNGLWIQSSVDSLNAFKKAIAHPAYISFVLNKNSLQNSCEFNGRAIENGASLIVYSASSVAAGETCTSEIRSCKNGTLSGSFTFESCQVQPPAQNLDAEYVRNLYITILKRNPSDSEVQYYVTQLQLKVMTREQIKAHFYAVCSTGEELCGKPQPVSCSFNGRQVAHGSSLTTYLNSSVPNGSSCQAQVRTCHNGTLSGAGDFESCTVNPPVQLTDREFVTVLYLTIFLRQPDEGGLNFYVSQIQSGTMSRDRVQAHFYNVCATGAEPCGR